MGRLEDKIAIITGAGSGIGQSMSRLFADEGARIVCADVSGAEETTAAGIGDHAIPVHVDVSVAADVERMVRTAEEQFGRLDVLCNNAGFGGPRRPIVEQDEATFDNVMAVNLKGVFFGMKYGIASMLRTGGGSVVNTASATGARRQVRGRSRPRHRPDRDDGRR